MKRVDFLVIGGGAAGIFAAIEHKRMFPNSSVVVLEKSGVLLSKVKISGGGRCNVTHSCFDLKELITHYPRGHKELFGPFHRFGPRETIAWFEQRGVSLKTEKDGRIFPVTDSSMTIITALLSEAEKLGVLILLRQQIASIAKGDEGFLIETENENFLAKALLLATGSSPAGFAFAEQLGHTIVKPVPSLFTFNVPTSSLKELSGATVSHVRVHVEGGKYVQEGPILITHFGFSGPAVLKLSAWEARFFAEWEYKATLHINWVPKHSKEEVINTYMRLKKESPKKQLGSEILFSLPKNLYRALLGSAVDMMIAHVSKEMIQTIAERLHDDRYQIDGKTTNKEEFVTCGGVDLKEIDFKSMHSKICPGLFFAGEILNIDGVTGGFNFQNAWTTGYLAGSAS